MTDRTAGTPEGDVDRFYRKQAPIYDWTRPLFLPARGRAIRRLALRPGLSVADFGCGTGLNFPGIRRAGPACLVGVDASPAMLARARRRDPDAELVEGDLATVRLDGRPFDRILCTWAVSLVPAWETALRNLRDHLAPDGVLVLLDFGRLRGPLAPLDPALRAWLRRFGVASDRPVAGFLAPRFESVRVESILGGYAFLVTARAPRGEADAAEAPDAVAPSPDR